VGFVVARVARKTDREGAHARAQARVTRLRTMREACSKGST
jgi:hypothetical protein